MAVYYKWIKGCQAGAKLSGTDAGLWTYLKWGSGTTGIDQMPTLHANVGKNDTTQSANFGYLLSTNMAADPTIYKRFNFKSRIFLTDPNGSYDTDYVTDDTIKPHHRGALYQAGNRFIIESFTKEGQEEDDIEYNDLLLHSKYSMMSGTNYFGVNSGTTERNDSLWYKMVVHEHGDEKGIWAAAPMIFWDPFGGSSQHENNYLEVRSWTGLGVRAIGLDSNTDRTHLTAFFPHYTSTENIIFNKKLEVKNQPVDAQYFNATSDKRAKENIQPATYSALELIKKLPVYTYNYKNKSENVTGILAQDLLKAQPEELDLVSNINATGENNDYMSIKNDKLMFVLMKAIQEQQEQIEKLQLEIEKLKNI